MKLRILNSYLSSDWKLKRGFDKWGENFHCKEGVKSDQEATATTEAGVAGGIYYKMSGNCFYHLPVF